MVMTLTNLQTTCRCDELTPNARWGFRTDDWYCPQCGVPLCRFVDPAHAVDSAATIADDTEFWLYPLPGGDALRFHLKLFQLQPQSDRSAVRISPEIIHAELIGVNDFQVTLLPLRPHQPAVVEITARNALTDGIPPTGKRLRLRISGHFPVTTLNVRLCRTPTVQWDLSGRGIRPQDDEHSRWLIQRADRLELDVRLITQQAPLKLTRSLDPQAFKAMSGMLARVPEVHTTSAPLPGTEISIDHPARWQMQLHAEVFQNEGERLSLAPTLEFVGWDGELPMIDLDYVPSTIRITPAELNIGTMYWGEVRSNDRDDHETNPDDPYLLPVIGELSVENGGDQPRLLRRPTIEPADDPARYWFHVDWHPSVTVDENGLAVVPPFQHALLLVRVDLQQAPTVMQRERMDPGPRVRLKIEAGDGTDFWHTTISVAAVEPRRPLPYPLAIDFGNSFSFAAVLNEGALDLPDELVIAAHDRYHPDGFPTALLIRRFNHAHPLRSDYVIGSAALAELAQGHAETSWPLMDLKRWLSDVRDDESRSVTVAGQLQPTVRVSVLAQMYLYGLIRRAEALLRQYYVTRIVSSYPAKLDPLARRRFIHLMNDLCKQVTTLRHDLAQPITHVLDRIDEANAVATGFVLDPEQRQEYFPDDAEPRSEFVVASCDFGGGSFDTALLRFRVLDPEAALPEFSSEYLGIGGLTDFGGDNVTVAVFELLKARVAARLADSHLPATLLNDVPRPGQQHPRTGAPRWLFEVLWAAADGLKQQLCEPTDEQPEIELPRCTNAPDFLAFRELVANMLRQRTDLPTLDDLYRHELQYDLRGPANYTIPQRIEWILKELKEFENRAGTAIDFIVLGGGGSRIQLVREMIQDTFPQARLVYQRDRLKRRVADGLVLTVNYLTSEQHQLALSGSYITRSLGVVGSGIRAPIELIPACTLVNEHVEFPLADRGKRIALQQLQSEHGNPLLYANVKEKSRIRLGTFPIAELKLPRDNDTVVTLGFGPMDPQGEWTEEDRLELRIHRPDQSWRIRLKPLR